MKKIFTLLCLFACPALASAQTITSIGASAVKAGDDFATKTFQDPWDMNQRTDLGWWVNSVDQPNSGYVQPVTFASGEFVGVTNTTNPYVNLLDSGFPPAARIGKTGYVFPINASTYKYVAVRIDVGTAADNIQFIWNRTDIFDSTTTTAFNVATTGGYRIYLVDLTTLSTVGANKITWAGNIQALRMNTGFTASVTHRIDWVRLVAGDATTCRTIVWTGAANVDLYAVSTSGVSLGKIASNVTSGTASPGCTAPGSGYAYFAGALAPGTYRVGISAVGGTAPTFTTATGTTWVVNDAPTLTFTSPDPEGSSDDFATTILNNPWDMDSLSDLDLQTNITGASIRSDLSFETPAGVSLGTQRVYYGTSVDCANSAGGSTCSQNGVPVGDPYVDPFYTTARGFNYRIDATRYRIATVEFGVPNKARDLSAGSVGRFVWRVAGDAAENATADLVFNSRVGANVMDKITLDMADRVTVPKASGANDWVNGNSAQPGLDIFRFDPHEYPHPTDFYIKRVKLAALEKASATYTVRWQYADTQAGTVDLFYSSVNTGSCISGSPITSASVVASVGQATWNVSGVPDGTYYICARFSDGTNTNETYAKWPIVVQHSPTNSGPRLVLNRTNLNFGIVNRPNASSPLVATSAQTVRVTEVGGSGVCWTVASAVPAQTTYTVTLSGGGSQVCGSGSFTIAVNPASSNFNVSGVGEATFNVHEVTAGQTSNSPQYVHSVHQVYSGTSAPVGLVDTPASGATVSGSIAVTGWAVDDVDIVSVGIYRDAVAGEGAGPIFIGNATRVDDARTDIEAGNPLKPYNYRAGWGYLLLTNFLPGLGDGTYTLRIFANDIEGKQTLLGSPVITGTNSASTTPFGAIDTPAQGEVVNATTYNNFGWVLVRGTAHASPGYGDGASVSVIIDGAAVGSPVGWTSRPDLDALFPNPPFSGISKALGAFTFNPSLLTSGVHTIAWVVTANNGKADGIGSRYFTVVGGAGLVLTDPPQNAFVVSAPLSLNPGPDLGRRANAVGVLAASGPKAVLATEMQRVVVDASLKGAHRYDAYLVANGELRGLPIGASFDDTRGVLYWQPGVGYTGAYDFVVMRDGHDRLPVRVELQPRRERAPLKRGFAVQFATAPADAPAR